MQIKMSNFLYILPFVFIAYYLFRYFNDQSKDFRQYLEPELEKFGLKLISAAFLRPKFMEYPFNDLDEDVSINPIAGKFPVAPRHVHRHLRRVKFKDRYGNQFDAIAAIEFKDSQSKLFMRVRWKPDLNMFYNKNVEST